MTQTTGSLWKSVRNAALSLGLVASPVATALGFDTAAMLVAARPAQADSFWQKAFNGGLSRDQYIAGWAPVCGPVPCSPPPGCDIENYTGLNGQGLVLVCHKDMPPGYYAPPPYYDSPYPPPPPPGYYARPPYYGNGQ